MHILPVGVVTSTPTYLQHPQLPPQHRQLPLHLWQRRQCRLSPPFLAPLLLLAALPLQRLWRRRRRGGRQPVGGVGCWWG